MVDRIQNRNNGYSDSLFSKNVSLENNTFNSINGSTALKIDEQFDIETENNGLIKSDIDPVTEPNYKSEHALEIEKNEDMISGVSFDSASYIENNTQIENSVNEETIQSSESIAEEYTPQLFSEESSTDQNIETTKIDDNEESQQEDKLFDQTIGDEEDFEIPAFLRRQKF